MLNINFWDIAITIVNLLVLYALMKKFLVKPVRAIMEEREHKIESQLANAAQKQEQALNLKQDYEKKLETAGAEASALIKKAREIAQQEQERMIQETKEETQRIFEQSKKEIEFEQEKATRQAKKQISELALTAARKIMISGDINDANSN